MLTDSHRRWRPHRYEQRLWGCRALLEFPSVKLLDYAGQDAALETNSNPFAPVVRAHLVTTATRRDPVARLEHKRHLTCALYRHGWNREDILSIYTFIDWVLMRPAALEFERRRLGTRNVRGGVNALSRLESRSQSVYAT